MANQFRVPSLIVEPLSEEYNDLWITVTIEEPAVSSYNYLRSSYFVTEPAVSSYNTLRSTVIMIESLCQVLPEAPVSTNPFPGFGNSLLNPSTPQGADPFNSGLPGLSFSVHKKPMFNTQVSEAASGRETRNSLTEYPRWEFNLTYSFLEDSSGAESSLKQIMGFFLQRRGTFDSWLFKDPDDYLVTEGSLGEGDGVTTQFFFKRDLGGFLEIINQYDSANTITIFKKITETKVIPGIGPYEVTVTNSATFTSDYGVSIGGTPLTKVASSPASMEYSVNESTGVYTFNAAQASNNADILYSYSISTGFTLTAPNYIVFDTAPAVGEAILASFQFYFSCRFTDDIADFEKFMDQLWTYQECNFKSIIQ